MESSRKDDRLSATLEALRPVPAPAFAAGLDERAAAGFPRREGAGGSPWAAFADRMRSLSPRQVLLPSVATAFVAVVVATALVATNQPGTRLNIDTSGAAKQDTGGSTSGLLNKFSPSAPSGGVSESSAQPEAAEAEARLGHAPNLGAGAAPTSAAAHRDVERSAQVVLGAEPGAVAGDASQVFEAVHAARGIVLRSSVNEGSEEGAAGASFELLIPSAQLDDALGAISEIDEVLSRRDGSADITAPTIGATERLRDSQARIDSLLNELAVADTVIEREAVEAKLRLERRRASIWRAQVATLHQRASMSHVSVRIEGGGSGSGGGSWGIGDAAGDAGHILAVAAGVTLVGLAILAPVALLVLLVLLARRTWVRLERRRALG